MIRVVLFEDNNSLRQTLSMILSAVDGIQFTGAFPDANEAVARVRSHRPDVVVMDIQMPGTDGLEAMQKLKTNFPDVKVLIQTVFEDDHRIFAAICGGANGYVLKSPDPDALVNAIFDVEKGGSTLSPAVATKVLNMFQNQFVNRQASYVKLTERERDILSCMVQGQSYKMIAAQLEMSYNTVHWHIKNIYDKLHVNSAPEAVAKAISDKLV